MKEWRNKPRVLGKPLLRIYALRDEYRNKAGFTISVKDLAVISGNARFSYLPQLVRLALTIGQSDISRG